AEKPAKKKSSLVADGARRVQPSDGARRVQPSDGARRLQPSDGARRLQPSARGHMPNKTHTIGVISGDGIGKEVIPAGMAAIEKTAGGGAVSVSFTELPWSCEYYLRHQRMMDEDGF